MTVQFDNSYLEKLSADNATERRERLLARGYHEGRQAVHLTDRIKEFLEMHSEAQFRLNIIQSINNTLRDELNVSGFSTNDEGAKEQQSEWAEILWQNLRMDSLQNKVHETAVSEAEAFVIVDYDETKKSPTFTFHRRYIERTIAISGNQRLIGDGLGCWMIYENNDVDQTPLAAVKQWTETFPQNGLYITRDRKTVYYNDRIERFYLDAGGWLPFVEEGGTWPTPWVDNKGRPIGIPVIHFKNANYTSDSWEAIPLQDAINKTLIDILGTADLSGFPIFKVFGFYPTSDGLTPAADGSNTLKVQPMAFLGSNKAPSEASLDVIGAQSVEPLINTLIELIILAAQITSTPTSRFVVTRAIASADTIKEQERGLVKKANNRRVLFGDAWEDCMTMARKLANVFGGALMDEGVIFQTKWSQSQGEISIEQYEKTQELDNEIKIWVTAATVSRDSQGQIPVETVLLALGKTADELIDMPTQRLAAIKAAQEDVIPTEAQ